MPKELKKGNLFWRKALKRINIFLWNWTIIELGSLWEQKKLMPRWYTHILSGLTYFHFRHFEVFYSTNKIQFLNLLILIIRTKIQFHLSVYKICILSVLPLTKHFLLFEVHQFSLVLFQVSIHNTSMNRDVKNFHHVSNIVTVPIFRILLDIFQDIFPKYIYYEFVDIFSPSNFHVIVKLYDVLYLF